MGNITLYMAATATGHINAQVPVRLIYGNTLLQSHLRSLRILILSTAAAHRGTGSTKYSLELHGSG